jgi:ABC-2 type transport system ATP-binding protein
MAEVAGDHEMVRTSALTKVYPGGIRAVDNLNLSLRAGEVFGLLGPNGAGKTTTAGMLTTKVIPTSGRAFVADVDVVAQPALAKRFIGVVPQHNTLDRTLSVGENLFFHGRFFGMSAGEARDASNYWLDRMKLSRYGGAPVMALSGGMAQRLMVARAVLHRPEVLFLDEPTSGLDPQSRHALYDIIRELNADGQTVLLMTHYMEEADLLCERVAIIDHGVILALDTPAELKKSIQADTVVTVSVDNGPDRLATLFRSELPFVTDVREVDHSVVVSASGAAGVLPAIVSSADRAGFRITDVKVSEPTLETVFINLTGKELRD